LEDRARTGAPLRVPHTARQKAHRAPPQLGEKEKPLTRHEARLLRLATGLPNPTSFEVAEV